MGKTEKLEELLPLYIGRKVLIDSGAHKLIGAEGTLVGKTLSRALVQYAGEILEIEFVDIKLLLQPCAETFSQNGKNTLETYYETLMQYVATGKDIFGLIVDDLAVDANDYK